MPFIIEITPGGVPVGVYRARFIRVEDYTNDENDYGPGYKWVWQIVGGPHDGTEVIRVTSKKMGPKATLPKLLKMLYGRDLHPGESPDIEEMYGIEGTVVIEETEGGATRVGSFMRDASPSPDSATSATAGDASEIF